MHKLNSLETASVLDISGFELMHLRKQGSIACEKRERTFFYSLPAGHSVLAHPIGKELLNWYKGKHDFLQPNDPQEQGLNFAFENWLRETLTNPMEEPFRRQRLVQWSLAPGAKFCHPREEHLIPLHTCYGAAGGPVSKSYEFQMYGIRGSAYLWNSSNINN